MRIERTGQTLKDILRAAATSLPSIITAGISPALTLITLFAVTAAMTVSCARMGQPDGGWYDETPPRVTGETPKDGAVNVKTRKVEIFFNEFVKIDDATEKVVVSPPQIEMPEIKSMGRKIEVKLNDTLKAETTYTIDFSDAISDNNEGNPMGNYTYSFSTGEVIDTFQVAGHVLEAENLEPIKGILVGLYDDVADSAFISGPMLRVARTDSRGHFVIKGVAPGNYRVYALEDADGDYRFSQKSERIAFSRDVFTPSTADAVRQDTVWTDSLHIKSIGRVGYTRFTPDDIVLRAFTEPLSDRYFLKSERTEPDRFTLFFSYGDSRLPEVTGLNFDSRDAFIIEHSLKNDTITYWLRDTTLVNNDSLNIRLRYMATDTTGVLGMKTDTLLLLSKKTYEKRMKDAKREYDDWKKRQDRNRKRGLPYDSIMPPKELKYKVELPPSFDPDKNIPFDFDTPLARIDTTMIHLYAKHDSLWYNAAFDFVDRYAVSDSVADAAHINRRAYSLRGEWRPDTEYSLEIDSAAFTDIYGLTTRKLKKGFKVHSLDDYSTLIVTVTNIGRQPMVMQLLNSSDHVVKEVRMTDNTAQFFYVTPDKYYLRLILDSNNNGRWDTGDYASGRQPEQVYYYNEQIECRAKWDVTKSWNPTQRPLTQQKPSAITRQKGENTKKIRQRNIERARQLGKEYVPPTE